MLSPLLHESAALYRALRSISPEGELIRQERPDIVLIRHSLHQFSGMVAAHRAGIPVVMEVNAPAGYEYRTYRKGYHLIPGLADWVEDRTLASADGMFVVSRMLQRHFAGRGVPEEKIRVIPNGADVDRFHPRHLDREMRVALGEGSVVVGFVGSFAPFHGVDQLREAIQFAAPRRPETRFLMVGAGELSGDLEEQCRRLGLADRVRFTGHVPPERVPGLMGAADILLAPYEAEDFFYLSPIKIFEYMASGRAVLGARVGQVGEVITHGVDGLLYDPADRDSFRRELLRLVEDAELRRRLGEAARRTIETRYTWRANAEAVSTLLEWARERNRRGSA
jgi:glycosyltransferase involved in cell wall biosynthesis